MSEQDLVLRHLRTIDLLPGHNVHRLIERESDREAVQERRRAGE